jgi:DnaJ-class molecular chaperone
MNYCPHCGYKLENPKYTVCPNCSKRLRYPPIPVDLSGGEIVKCATCNGTGEAKTEGFLFTSVETCPVCGGTGVNRV